MEPGLAVPEEIKRHRRRRRGLRYTAQRGNRGYSKGNREPGAGVPAVSAKGLAKVNPEWFFVCLGYNMKRLVRLAHG
jgi:hypothetical protein